MAAREGAQAELPSAEDTEPDTEAEPEGAGPRGIGERLMVGAFHKCRPICDGAGLCSIGRWAPWARPETRHPRLRGMRRAYCQWGP